MPDDSSTKELQSSFRFLIKAWNNRVKEVAGKGYRGGVYWTWDAMGIVNVEFGVWKGGKELGAVYASLGPLSETHEEEYRAFFEQHPEEAELTSSYKHLGAMERAMWAREAEDLGGDFIYYKEVEDAIRRIAAGKPDRNESPHYGVLNPYSKFWEFGSMSQGPYFGGGA